MTESAPDVTVTGLIDSLGNNDIGSITEETVRSIVAYARQGSVERSTASGVNLGSLPAGSIWQNLPEPNNGIKYTLLNKFATSHLVSSGLMTGSNTNVGLTYEATPPSGTTSSPTQPRQVIVNWSIGISSSYDSLWGVSWWRVPNGSAWPSGDAGWPGTDTEPTRDPISPLDIALFGSSLINLEGDSYVAPHSGSITVTMHPGDMLVPALEYYGTLNATGTTDPQGTLNSFIVKATMTSPVENVNAPNPIAGSEILSVKDNINPELDAAQTAINYRTAFVGSNVDVAPADVRRSILIRANRPVTPANGTTVYNTAAIAGGAPAKRLGIYNEAPVGGTDSWSEFEPIQSPQSFEPKVMQNAAVTTRTGIAVQTGGENFTARYVVTGKLVNVWLTCSMNGTGTADKAIRFELPVTPSTNLKSTSTLGNASIWDSTGGDRYHAVCEYNRTEQSAGSETYYHDCVFAVTVANSAAAVGTTASTAPVTIATGDGIRLQLTYFID